MIKATMALALAFGFCSASADVTTVCGQFGGQEKCEGFVANSHLNYDSVNLLSTGDIEFVNPKVLVRENQFDSLYAYGGYASYCEYLNLHAKWMIPGQTWFGRNVELAFLVGLRADETSVSVYRVPVFSIEESSYYVSSIACGKD